MDIDLIFKNRKIFALEERIWEYKDKILKNEKSINKMGKLFDINIIDEDGEFRQNNE